MPMWRLSNALPYSIDYRLQYQFDYDRCPQKALSDPMIFTNIMMARYGLFDLQGRLDPSNVFWHVTDARLIGVQTNLTLVLGIRRTEPELQQRVRSFLSAFPCGRSLRDSPYQVITQTNTEAGA